MINLLLNDHLEVRSHQLELLSQQLFFGLLEHGRKLQLYKIQDEMEIILYCNHHIMIGFMQKKDIEKQKYHQLRQKDCVFVTNQLSRLNTREGQEQIFNHILCLLTLSGLSELLQIDFLSLLQQTTMTETNNTKPIETQQQSANSNTEDDGKTTTKTDVKENSSTPLFRHYQKNLVLFAYNREVDEDPPHQIMVLQQSKKRYNKITEEDRVMEMFGNFNLQGTTEKLFLTKIDPLEHKEIAKEIKEMLQVADSLSRKDRFERRKQIFQSTRPQKVAQQLASEEVLAKRTIRVVKMDSLIQGGSIKGVVELGGKSIQYENFNMTQNQDYYALVRRKVRADEVFPQVSIEQNLLTGIDFEDPAIDEQKNPNDDDYDSNDSENSAFDYPEEEESERSSQEIIRDYDEEDNEYQEGNEEDDEELYMKYLRRERRRQRQMEEQFESKYQEYD